MCAGLLGLVGCATPQPYVTAERMDRGLVIVLTGIEGASRLNRAICRGLETGGVDWAIYLEDWTSFLGPLWTLRAYDRNRRKAQQLAHRVMRYHWDYPARPVVLVGQSGGGAMAVWVAEALDDGHAVDGIVMLAAALSPGYSLEFALRKSSRGIVNFYSARDWVFLGVGTTIYGTMDARHGSSAGRTGFRTPGHPASAPACGERLYGKLYQIAWSPRMTSSGYSGGHLTSGAMRFVEEYVAPLVLAETWDNALMEVIRRKRPRFAPAGARCAMTAHCCRSARSGG